MSVPSGSDYFTERDMRLRAEAERDRYLDALREIDTMDPDDFMQGQGHLAPAFQQPNFRQAFRFVCRVVNGVLRGTDENGEPLPGLTPEQRSRLVADAEWHSVNADQVD